jgi:cytochrome c-type biogenesis protein CcmI
MFAGVSLGLLLVVGALVVRPLLAKRVAVPNSQENEMAQRASLREARAIIETERANGSISDEAAESRRADLLIRARAEQPDTMRTLTDSGKQTAAAIVCVLSLACVAGAVYVMVGKLDGLTAAKRSPPAQTQVTPEQIEQMVGRLEARLSAEPPKAEDLPQWKMLARSQMMLGKPDGAVTALRAVIALGGPTSENETNLAEALLAQQQGKPNDEILKLLSSAYRKSPTDQKVLWLNAAVAQERGDKAGAVKYLNELLPTVDATSQEAADIRRFVAELSK